MKQTVLHQKHLQLKAKMTDFQGLADPAPVFRCAGGISRGADSRGSVRYQLPGQDRDRRPGRLGPPSERAHQKHRKNNHRFGAFSAHLQ